MSDVMKIGIILPAVGLLLIAIAVILLIRTIIFSISSKKVKGAIVGLAYYPNGQDGSRYDPVFQFTTTDGRTMEVEDNTGTNPPQFRVGQSVDILYDPKNPGHAHINKKSNLYFAPLLLICMGLCLACVGGVFFMFK